MEKYKIVFLGDLGVGKTSIINQFINNTFDETHQPTIGIDFLSKTIYLDDRTIRLQLWDTAGQERFRALIPSYIRDCSAAVIIYDVTSVESFQNLDKWVDDVQKERGPDAVIIIVGNKTDLQRRVSPEMAEQKAKQLQLTYFEVSAKTGDMIQNLFLGLSSSFPGMADVQLTPGNQVQSDTVNLETPNSKQKKCC